jgi:hypothetical protein
MATTCDINSGFALGCRDNVGGLKSIYILSGSISNISSASPGLITGITGSGVWYQFQLFRQTSNYQEELAVTPENGTVIYNQTCNAVFFKMQTATRNQVRVLAQNSNLKIIVETNNGVDTGDAKWFLMGQVNGAQLLSGTSQTGTAFTDLNGYNLVFTGNEQAPASEVSGSGTSFSSVLTGMTVVTY